MPGEASSQDKFPVVAEMAADEASRRGKLPLLRVSRLGYYGCAAAQPANGVGQGKLTETIRQIPTGACGTAKLV